MRITNMSIVMYWAFKFQKCKIIFKRSSIVLTVDDHSLHIFRYGTLAFQLSGYIKFTKNGYQRSQEPEKYNEFY